MLTISRDPPANDPVKRTPTGFPEAMLLAQSAPPVLTPVQFAGLGKGAALGSYLAVWGAMGWQLGAAAPSIKHGIKLGEGRILSRDTVFDTRLPNGAPARVQGREGDILYVGPDGRRYLMVDIIKVPFTKYPISNGTLSGTLVAIDPPARR